MNTKTAVATAIGTTSTEAEILAATAQALADGHDPLGDDDDEGQTEIKSATVADLIGDDEGEAGGAGADSGAAGTVVDEGGAALTAEQLAAIAADEVPAPAAAKAPRYDTGDPATFDTQRKELNATKAKALKDLMDGIIEPDAYSVIESEVSEKLDHLTELRTLHRANVQTEAQTEGAVLDNIMASALKAGEVDYTDPVASKQFDIALSMLQAGGDKRTFAELAADAHKAVLAIRGAKPKPKTAEEVAAEAAAAHAKPRENGKGPMTLRDVPAASTPNSGEGWEAQLAKLSGQDYEEAYSRLTPGQRAQLLND